MCWEEKEKQVGRWVSGWVGIGESLTCSLRGLLVMSWMERTPRSLRIEGTMSYVLWEVGGWVSGWVRWGND